MSRRAWAVLAVGLVLAVAAAVWSGRGGERTARLDPDNPGRDGARAVARVLADRGVAVDVVRDAEAMEDAPLHGATVVVTSPSSLGRSTMSRLLGRVRGQVPVVLIDPTPQLTGTFGETTQAPLADRTGRGVDAGCAEPALAGLRLEADRLLAYPASSSEATTCFDLGSRSVYRHRRDGLTVLGAGDALTNGQVLRADNAAVALRLLGARDRVVWYVPDPADLAAGDEVGLAGLLPRWLVPALWLTGLVVLAALLWRGRRLGPVVAEPLPVVVRAVETTLARGRLYRRAGDRGHAAAVLRGAARDRWRDRLRLPSDASTGTLLSETARAAGRPVAEVAGLLDPAAPVPANDRALAVLARELDRLRPAGTPAPEPASDPTSDPAPDPTSALTSAPTDGSRP